jgi:hypothetical protein
MRLMSICGLTALSLGLTQGTGRACDTDDLGDVQEFSAPMMIAYGGYGSPQQQQFVPQQAPQYDACQAPQAAPVIVQQAPVVGSGGGLNVGRKVRIKIKKSPGASVGF